MIIFLIGYMGCGKSTMGRKLASHLGYEFIDLDKFIEERHFRTIPQIFASDGETAFREMEHKALLEVANFENVVVGTGGGAPCFFENMAIMNNVGITIYLSPSVETLAQRLINSKTARPLIKGKSHAELVQFIKDSLQKRSPFYERAHIKIENINNLETGRLVAILNQYLETPNN